MARDIYHDLAKQALIKAGWQITHDPYTLPIGGQHLYIDLGAEKVLAAEKEGQKIAVEIKSFLKPSPLSDLEQALGQYLFYRSLLQRHEPYRIIYLAVPLNAYKTVFSSVIGRIMIEDHHLKLMVFDTDTEEITQWIN